MQRRNSVDFAAEAAARNGSGKELYIRKGRRQEQRAMQVDGREMIFRRTRKGLGTGDGSKGTRSLSTAYKVKDSLA